MNDKDIPASWSNTEIEQITLAVEKIDPKKYPDKEFVYLDISGIDNKHNKIEEIKRYSGENAPSRARQLVKQNDVLFSTVRTYLKNIAQVAEKYDGQIASTGFSVLRAASGIEPKYLFYFTLTNHFLKFLEALQRGTSYPAVRDIDVRRQKIPIPPENEQHRIVAKIEELFSDLDDGIASLKKAQAQLKTYRQAVLKYAFEGKLTAAWRKSRAEAQRRREQPEEENLCVSASLRDAKFLLETIQQDRERRYTQQLDAWQQAVKAWQTVGQSGPKPAKPQSPKNLPPLTVAELAELPDLPEGWCWCRLLSVVEDIFDGPFGSNLKTEDYVDSGIRIIRLENIGFLEFDDERKSFITPKKYETLKKHTVSAGDIIFSSFISDQTRVVVLPDYIQLAVNKADCFCIRVFHELVSNNFLASFLSTRLAYNFLVQEVHGATRPRINTTQLKNAVIPLCSTSEQHQIVAEIEARLSVCDKLEQTLADSLRQADALRQSILKRAFAGRLVPQDPNDEPAERLLERIKNSRRGAETQRRKT